MVEQISEQTVLDLIQKMYSGERFLDKREKDPSPDHFYEVGKELANFLKENAIKSGGSIDDIVIAIGGDCRRSTPELIDRFVDGVIDAGISAIYLGYNRSTPSIEWAGERLGVDAVVAVTASHFGPDRNGLKITINGAHKKISTSPSRRHFEDEIENFYGKSLFDVAHNLYGVSIAVDSMYGASAKTFSDAATKAGTNISAIHNIPNGNFPTLVKNAPDPSDYKNLAELRTEVKNGKYDFGIALDGDADRLVVVEESGRIIPPEYLGLVFAKYISNNGYTSPVVVEKKLKFVKDALGNMGLQMIEVDTGRPYIMSGMDSAGAGLGYELSGHIFFRNAQVGNDSLDWNDDAMKTGLYLANIVKETGKKVSELVDEACNGLPFTVGEIRFHYSRQSTLDIIAGLNLVYDSTSPKEITISDGDNTLYLRPSANSDEVTAVVYGNNKGSTKTFLDDTLDRIAVKNSEWKRFADKFNIAYEQKAEARELEFYQPKMLVLATNH